MAQWESLFTHHIPEAHLVIVGAPKFGLGAHMMWGFLESYDLVHIRPGWVMLYWVHLGQWFSTAGHDH